MPTFITGTKTSREVYGTWRYAAPIGGLAAGALAAVAFCPAHDDSASIFRLSGGGKTMATSLERHRPNLHTGQKYRSLAGHCPSGSRDNYKSSWTPNAIQTNGVLMRSHKLLHGAVGLQLSCLPALAKQHKANRTTSPWRAAAGPEIPHERRPHYARVPKVWIRSGRLRAEGSTVDGLRSQEPCRANFDRPG
jgi:hypothetical protein